MSTNRCEEKISELTSPANYVLNVYLTCSDTTQNISNVDRHLA